MQLITAASAVFCAWHAIPTATLLQGKQVLKDGIGRAPEEEEPVDPALARQFLQVCCCFSSGCSNLTWLGRMAFRAGSCVGGACRPRPGPAIPSGAHIIANRWSGAWWQ